ncbi:hypothetical protein JCM10213_000225 [Rhodosporidiobolus nylandii]
MLRTLPSLFILLAALVVVASSPAAAVNPGNSTAPGFQLDLSRRFSSTVEMLKTRRGPSKTSKASTRKRTVSEELLAMLKSAANVLAPAAEPSAHVAAARPGPSAHVAAGRPGPSARVAAARGGPSARVAAARAGPSAHVAAAGKPSASAAASAWASHAALAGAQPSASAQPSSVKQAQQNVEYVKRMIQQEPWETLDSRLLCPIGETACPIFPRAGTYECVDVSTELESCGGCIVKGAGEDCTEIQGAQGVTCQSGGCVVFTCQPGWKLDSDFKRTNGGKGRCRKVLAQKERRSPGPAAQEAAEKAEVEKREAGADAH